MAKSDHRSQQLMELKGIGLIKNYTGVDMPGKHL